MERKERLESKKERLQLYLQREAEMLKGGVQSYGVGTRNATRYSTDLAVIAKKIEELEDEIKEMEDLMAGKSPRRAVGVVPIDG